MDLLKILTFTVRRVHTFMIGDRSFVQNFGFAYRTNIMIVLVVSRFTVEQFLTELNFTNKTEFNYKIAYINTADFT
jgi:hypothetical protein